MGTIITISTISGILVYAYESYKICCKLKQIERGEVEIVRGVKKSKKQGTKEFNEMVFNLAKERSGNNGIY